MSEGKMFNKSLPIIVRLIRIFMSMAVDSQKRGIYSYVLIGILLSIMLPGHTMAVPPGTTIDNTAQCAYIVGDTSLVIANSNVVTLMTVDARSASTIEFLQYAPTNPQAEFILVAITHYSISGTEAGPFEPLPEPIPLGSDEPLNLSVPTPLISTNQYRKGNPIFIRVTDPDQNVDSLNAENVFVNIISDSHSDSEVLRLSETGPNMGIFVGYISATTELLATSNNGVLAMDNQSEIVISYTDMIDPADDASASAQINTDGIVFDSHSGYPVDGVIITLVDANTGQPATVFGDDSVSVFPATIISGGSITDAGGTIYDFSSGRFRFPYLNVGRYRLDVTPPSNYTVPSNVSTAALQALPGAPFAIIEPGSRGEPFELTLNQNFVIDIPIDPWLYLTKSVNKDVVSPGDYLQYCLTLNNQVGTILSGLYVEDRLPQGFRYQQGSAYINGINTGNPEISSNGRILTFRLDDIANDSTIVIKYVIEIAANAELGEATNWAVVKDAIRKISNTAQTTVQVKDELFRNNCFIMGNVIRDNPGDSGKESNNGIEGVRIYLEDGTYTTTDHNGMFHFEGISPGVHVVQLDQESLQEQYELVDYEEGNHFAGRTYSRFVDLQGGTMWRTDFHIKLKPRMKGELSLELNNYAQKNTFSFGAEIHNHTVPLSNLRLIIMLPDDIGYKKGSSHIDHSSIPDPIINENILTYYLGSIPDAWTKQIHFQADIHAPKIEDGLYTTGVLLFDSPSETNQRTTPLKSILSLTSMDESAFANRTFERSTTDLGVLTEGESDTARGRESSQSTTPKKKVVIETSGLRPGEKYVSLDDCEKVIHESADFDLTSFEDMDPGFEWLWPEPDYYPSIPSLKVVIKHHYGNSLKLILNDVEVSPLNFDETIADELRTISISRWVGIDLQDGTNHFSIIEYDTVSGDTNNIQRIFHYSGPPVHAEVVTENSDLISDGITPPIIAVLLTDKDGHPAREGVIGRFSVHAPYSSHREIEEFQDGAESLFEKREPHYVVGKNGIALIRLQPTSVSGEAVLKFGLLEGEKEIRVWLEPRMREWILVGLAQTTLGYNTVKGYTQYMNRPNLDDKFYEDGRFAFFGKGQIGDKWLMTVAYDTKKDKTKVGNSLYRTITPNTFYPLYGDATQQSYDAPSTKNLYLKIERDRAYATFGDYNTSLTTTELTRYNRTLNGLKSEMYAGRYSWNLFVSRSDQTYARDEIRGDGTSGLYNLSYRSILINSEKVVVETRDRFRSEVILTSRCLKRHIDYNIDYEHGTLFFKQPVPSRDDRFNPVYIIIDYESRNVSEKLYNYGCRGAISISDDELVIGASYIHEEGVGTDGNLVGADATFNLSSKTRLKAELAASRVDSQTVQEEGNAYRLELMHCSSKLNGKLYLYHQDVGFGLGQQNSTESGTFKTGFDAAYQINGKTGLIGTAYHQSNLAAASDRNVVEATACVTGRLYTVRSGLRYAEDLLGDSAINRSAQIMTTGGYSVLDNRLRFRLDHEQSLRENNANPDYPTRTTISIDHKLTRSVDIFAKHEFTWAENEDGQNTRLGLKTTPWNGGQAHSAIGRLSTENYARVFANLGLTQIWRINDQWSINASLDHCETIQHHPTVASTTDSTQAGSGYNDFTAVSIGKTCREEKWFWTTRIESRNTARENKWGLTTAIYGEIRNGLGLSSAMQLFDTKSFVGEHKIDGNLRFGLACRPKNSKFVALDRLDLIIDNMSGGDFAYDAWRIVNNVNINYKLNTKTQTAFQYGAKYVVERIENKHYGGYIDLIGLETRYEFAALWDIGIKANVLHSWNSNQYDYHTSLSIGHNVLQNAWLSLGYNISGFDDKDFSQTNYTVKGPFIRFRFKIDQETANDILKLLKLNDDH